MATYCTVKSCRYPDSHNSRAHQCHKCFNYGHGTNECDVTNLTHGIKYINIPQDKRCTISGCNHSDNHTTQGHQCRSCKQYGHGWKHCNIYVKCELCNSTGHISSECISSDPTKIAGSALGHIYEGMAC